jgi:hypothetical protein
MSNITHNTNIKFDIDFCTSPKLEINLEENDDSKYIPFKIENIQNYNPLYSQFMDTNSSTLESISLNHKYHAVDLGNVMNLENNEKIEKPVFVKFSPLLDPTRYLIGKYETPETWILPQLHESTENVNKSNAKLAEYNNASYVDNFFSYLTSQLKHNHGMENSIDYYGSYLGIQEKFKINIADDIDYLNQSKYFNENKNKLFLVDEFSNYNEYFEYGSRNNKKKIKIGSNSNSISNISVLSLDDIAEIDESLECPMEIDAPLVEENDNDEIIYEKIKDGESVASSDDDSDLNYSSESESDSNESNEEPHDDDDDDSAQFEDCDDDENENDEDNENNEDKEDYESTSSIDEEPILNAYLPNFPVQMICLEKCQGTLDQLFENGEMDENTTSSALFQVIMTLLCYQKAFWFTHNDLHTNNIMYIETEEEFIYYLYKNVYYKVPTFGKIFKIIDFGRAIYKFKNKIFCSDSFAPGGDASTQYNFEPFFNLNKPRLEPNFSFDLCRLGCSIYDFIIEEDENFNEMDRIQKLIHTWCSDDNGKNVLYKKNGDERYPNFKLYKMIARNVNKHSPEAQLEYDVFKEYISSEIPECGSLIIDIDSIPKYYV